MAGSYLQNMIVIQLRSTQTLSKWVRAFCNEMIKVEFRFVTSPIRFAIAMRESRRL